MSNPDSEYWGRKARGTCGKGVRGNENEAWWDWLDEQGRRDRENNDDGCGDLRLKRRWENADGSPRETPRDDF
jgi:hypothetical protein